MSLNMCIYVKKNPKLITMSITDQETAHKWSYFKQHIGWTKSNVL